MKKDTQVREKLIIENELKFEISNRQDFKRIFDYLNMHYDIIPYKNADMYDYYFDTEENLLWNNGVIYRIRYRPQISINCKLQPKRTGFIWSRFEYSCKINSKKKKWEDLFGLDCQINNLLKKNFQIDLQKDLKNRIIVNSHRIGFNVRFKNKNVFNEHELVGVAFFDCSRDILHDITFMEFEMEAYEQTDVFSSPYIFEEFNKIGEYVESLGIRPSNLSKFARCLNQ